MGKHLFWSNFVISKCETYKSLHMENVRDIEKMHKIDLSGYKGDQRKDKISRNMVHYNIGNHIFNLAKGIVKSNNTTQLTLL